MNQQILAAAIFLFTYAVIVSERVHRTAAALLGGLLMIILGVVPQDDVFRALDLNVIFLLLGMMMIAYMLGQTGVFQWLAVKSVILGKGNPMSIMLIIAGVTAVASALLDNVTVVVLIAPVTLFVASTLGMSPIPFLITEVMASNIGGAATLIGDPPNILIGSAADIDFIPFVINMGPPIVVILLLYLPMAAWQFRKQMNVTAERSEAVMRLDTSELISDTTLLRQSLVVLGLVMVGFLVHGSLHLEPATIALSGATVLLIWTRRDPTEVLEHVEWATLMFFIGLFITIEALVTTGLISRIADSFLQATQGDLRVTTMLILWFSALASGLVDNIPYTAVMIPLVKNLGLSMDIVPVWWALALGADLGGNLTLVAASANLVAASLAERSGYKIKFLQFMRYGIPVVFMSLLVASFWLWIAYLR